MLCVRLPPSNNQQIWSLHLQYLSLRFDVLELVKFSSSTTWAFFASLFPVFFAFKIAVPERPSLTLTRASFVDFALSGFIVEKDTIAIAKLFEKFDFLVLPTAQVFPFNKQTHWPNQINGSPMDTYHRWMEVVIAGTLAGTPVINVPAGFSNHPNSKGLPMGLQIICKRYADFEALQIAYAYEQATRWNLDHRPPALQARN